jgi:hypothetical protein
MNPFCSPRIEIIYSDFWMTHVLLMSLVGALTNEWPIHVHRRRPFLVRQYNLTPNVFATHALVMAIRSPGQRPSFSHLMPRGPSDPFLMLMTSEHPRDGLGPRRHAWGSVAGRDETTQPSLGSIPYTTLCDTTAPVGFDSHRKYTLHNTRSIVYNKITSLPATCARQKSLSFWDQLQHNWCKIHWLV